MLTRLPSLLTRSSRNSLTCSRFHASSSSSLSVSKETLSSTSKWKPLSELVNLPTSEKNKPENYVALDESVDASIKIIRDWVVRESDMSGTLRKPPLVISRMARGGKTTLLQGIFDALKRDGDSYYPMIISFNESSGFQRLQNETSLHALLRLISSQLLTSPPSSASASASSLSSPSSPPISSMEMIQHINEEIQRKQGRFILLIDEINRLGLPLDVTASDFLKKHFLDPLNFYLVVTSHVLFDIDTQIPTLTTVLSGGSYREYKTVPLPLSFDLNQYHLMSPICTDITPAEISLYLGIPSLLYSQRMGNFSPKRRVERHVEDLEDIHLQGISSGSSLKSKDRLQSFLSEFMNGRKETGDNPSLSSVSTRMMVFIDIHYVTFSSLLKL